MAATQRRVLSGALPSGIIVLVALTAGCEPLTPVQPADDLPAALDSLDSHIATLNGQSHGDRLARIAEHLTASGQFAAVDVASEFDCVWARTPDGVLLIVRDDPADPSPSEGTELNRTSRTAKDRAETVITKTNRELTSMPAMRPAGKSVTPSLSAVNADWASRTEMPEGRVHLAGCYGGWGTQFSNTWDGYVGLYLENRGYELAPGWTVPEEDPQSYATVDALSTLQNVGIFYIKTFAGAGKLAGSDALVPALMTTTPVDVPNEAAYRPLLRVGLLAVMDVPVVPGSNERMRRFAITPTFIRERMRFAPNALVYVDAGYGDTAELRQAFIDRGASLYFVWDGPPSDEFSANAADFLFGRLCGHYLYPADFPAREPQDRPFEARSVFADLHRSGLGRYTIEGTPTGPQFASLNMTEGGGQLGILTPTIAYLKVDENPPDDPAYAWLHIKGIFGEDPGAGRRRVAMGNPLSPGAVLEDLNVIAWGPTEIVCELPVTGPGAAGRVWVAIDERKQSNAVPLTAWHLPLHVYLRQERGDWYEADLLIHLRFDVHGYRRGCGESPYFPLLPVDEFADASRNGLATESSGHWSSGGEWLFPESQPNNWARVSGSGDLPYRSSQQLISPSLRGDARVWFDQSGWPQTVNPLRIRLRIALTPTGGPLYSWGAWDPDDGTYGPPLETYGIGFPLPTPGHEFDLELDEEFRIKAGQSGPTGTPALITWGETAPGDYLSPRVDDPR